MGQSPLSDAAGTSTPFASVRLGAALEPKGSQVFLLGGLALCAFLVLMAVFALNSGPWLSACLAVVAFLLLVFVCIGWAISQKDTDLSSAPATVISGPSGSVTTAAGTLHSESAALNLKQLTDAVLTRQPLPAPDGLFVDGVVSTDPASLAKAEQIVIEANAEGQRQANALVGELRQPEAALTQQPLNVVAPQA